MNSTPDPEAAGFDADRLERIEEHFRTAYVEPGKIAGFQVAVGRRGQLAYRTTVGAMDLETGTPLHDQTIWRLYSMSKPVTGVALLSLAERAEVKLNDPIHRFLPEWRDVKVSVKRADGGVELVDLDRLISVKHADGQLLTHGNGRRARFSCGAVPRRRRSGSIRPRMCMRCS